MESLWTPLLHLSECPPKQFCFLEPFLSQAQKNRVDSVVQRGYRVGWEEVTLNKGCPGREEIYRG
jgi:hypothetical protein